MRPGWLAVPLLAAVLLAGCDRMDMAEPPPPRLPLPEPADRLVDHLSDRLAPQSGPFFPDLSIEDAVDVPGGGRMEFVVGLGMRCQGNASAIAPGARGWVTCGVRLASDPSAQATSVRELDLGFDYQPVTQRVAAQPVEWRVSVDVADETDALFTRFDTGWRAVDLSPLVSAPSVALEVQDPCDRPDSVEGIHPPFGPAGDAVLNVSFQVWHARPTVHVDLARSHPGPPASYPYAQPEPGNTTFAAAFPVWDVPVLMWLSLPVDLEAEETPDGSAGPCDATVAHQVQEWTVTVSYVGADGRGGEHVVPLPVDVYLSA